jgi:hypothetical protein
MSEKPNIKGWVISIIMALSLVIFATNSCTEKQSLEEKAVNDVKEYNRRYCPTPAVNYIRTDSITFDAKKHCFTYHCSFCDLLDNPDVVAFNKDKITKVLHSSVKNSTSMRTYIESGYRFRYVCHSDQSPQTVLFELNI